MLGAGDEVQRGILALRTSQTPAGTHTGHWELNPERRSQDTDCHRRERTVRSWRPSGIGQELHSAEPMRFHGCGAPEELDTEHSSLPLQHSNSTKKETQGLEWRRSRHGLGLWQVRCYQPPLNWIYSTHGWPHLQRESALLSSLHIRQQNRIWGKLTSSQVRNSGKTENVNYSPEISYGTKTHWCILSSLCSSLGLWGVKLVTSGQVLPSGIASGQERSRGRESLGLNTSSVIYSL